MKVVWTIAKFGFAIALLAVAVVFVILAFNHGDPDAAYKASAVVRELDQAEREHKDVLGIVMNRAKSMNDEDAANVLRWLEQRSARGDIPYLYFIGAYHARLKHAEESLRYYTAGALVYRVDREKCGDPTASQAVPIMESVFQLGKTQAMLKAHPEIRQRVVSWALDFEEKNPNREAPKWICAHGLSAFQQFGARPASPPTESAWQDKRRQIRSEFEKAYAAS